MILKRLAALLAAVMIPLCCCTINASAEKHVVTVYNERNGLPTGEANDVIQTDDGYIWIGSYGGLIRYDGTSFRNLSLEGDFPSSSIRALFEDSSGRLWVGTNDAGVFYIDNDTAVKISAEDNSFLCIRGFDEGKDGTIYAASNSGMAEIKDGSLIPCMDERVLGQTVYSVGTDSFGRVWCSLDSGICAVIKDGEVQRIFKSDEFFDNDDEIYCTAADCEGSIYLGSSGDTVLKLSFSSESLEPENIDISRLTVSGVTTHNSIRRTSDGRMAVCGSIGAAVISPDGSMTLFDGSQKASSVNSGCVDYEGNIWLASTSHGIIKYTKSYFETPNSEAGLDDVTLNAVAKQDTIYYAATDNGLLAFDSGWEPISNDLTEMYSGVRVRSLMTDSSGSLWTAAYSYTYPVSCMDKYGNITSYDGESGLINTNVRTLCELSDGSIAVGTQGGVSIIGKDGAIRSFGSDDGLENDSVLCFLEAPSGSLLVGSDGGGIYEINGDSVTCHGFSEGLSEGVVLRMIKDTDGGGYFVSAGSSLYYWENNAFRKIEIKKGAGSIFDLYDRDGKLWILQNNGIIAFDKKGILDGSGGMPVEYSFEHGLSGSLNANTWNMTDDGRLYISTRSGISIFGFEPVENVLPKGIINDVNIDGETVSGHGKVLVGKDAGRVTIDFSALSYTDTTDIGISYILDGFDREETVVIGEKSGSISYTNLPGGDYVFRLKIFEPASPENANVYSISVEKEMKFYERPFFLPLLIIIITAASVGAVLLISWIKIRNIRKRQKEYRDIVEQSLKTFAKAIDAKDQYTNGHSFRVAEYSAELARRMGKSRLEQENIYYIALLHDIGKIGIPDSILKKPGKLTDEEREIIHRHPLIGGEILKDFTALEGIADGAKYHHERYDGTGYCEKLAGKDIPEVARIIGVADTYDAMSSNRVYIKAFSNDAIVQELKDCSGTQLDPEVVPIMLDMIKDGFAPIKTEGSCTDSEDNKAE